MNQREGTRNQDIKPETMTTREKLKRRAVSVLSDYMVFDITDDELDELEAEIGRAAKQFLFEVHRGEMNFWDILIENYFRRCLRAVDDFLFTPAEEIRGDFHKNLNKAIEDLQEEGALP